MSIGEFNVDMKVKSTELFEEFLACSRLVNDNLKRMKEIIDKDETIVRVTSDE